MVTQFCMCLGLISAHFFVSPNFGRLKCQTNCKFNYCAAAFILFSCVTSSRVLDSKREEMSGSTLLRMHKQGSRYVLIRLISSVGSIFAIVTCTKIISRFWCSERRGEEEEEEELKKGGWGGAD